MGTDLQALDAWVVAQGGQVRTARAPASGGLRPGRRVAPPPTPPQRVYLLPAAAPARRGRGLPRRARRPAALSATSAARRLPHRALTASPRGAGRPVFGARVVVRGGVRLGAR